MGGMVWREMTPAVPKGIDCPFHGPLGEKTIDYCFLNGNSNRNTGPGQSGIGWGTDAGFMEFYI